MSKRFDLAFRARFLTVVAADERVIIVGLCAVPNLARTFYRGRSTFLLEERRDPLGWKTILWLEPERDFLVSRFLLMFENTCVVDMDIDYVRDTSYGWIPTGWRVTELIADGSRRLVSTAKVSRYTIR